MDEREFTALTPEANNQVNNPAEPYTAVPEQNQYTESQPPVNYSAPAQPAKKKNTGLIVAIALILALIIGGVACSYIFYFEPLGRYEDAEKDLRRGNYDDAKYTFEELGDFKDSRELVKECDYSKAEELMENGEYEKAIPLFSKLGEYKESKEKCNECNYTLAKKCFEDEDYEGAVKYYTAAGNYLDSADKLKESKYSYADFLYKERNRHGDAIALLKSIPDYNNSEKLIKEIETDYAKRLKTTYEIFITIIDSDSLSHEVRFSLLEAVDKVSYNYNAAVKALYDGTSYYEGYRLIIKSEWSQTVKKLNTSGSKLLRLYMNSLESLSNPPEEYAALYNLLKEAETPFKDYCEYVFVSTPPSPSTFRTTSTNYYNKCTPYVDKIKAEAARLNSVQFAE